MAKSIGLQLIEDRLKKQQEKGTQEYSSRTGKKIGDDFYTPDTDTLYRQYAKARGQKVAGGTANPIITSQRGVQANQNVSPSAERVAGRQTSYYDQMMQNKQRAEQMKANTKPSVRATAQDVKDALFGKAMNYGTVNPRISASEINTKYNSMTDDEASVYMTLRNQGRQAEADEYLKAVEYEINERNMNQTKQRAKEIGSDGVVAPLLYGAALSIPSSAGILYNAWQDAKGEATDMNHGAYGGSAAFNALYDAYVNGVNGEESPQWKKDLKGTAMTVAQMMGHMPAGMFAPLTMGASAASGASMDALNRGGTTEQALFGGLAAGAAEGAGSALSLGTMGKIFGKLGSKVSGKGMDRLRNLAKEIRKDKGRAIAIDLLKISGVEGSEEMVTEVMNALTDMAIMGENSNFNLVMEDAMAKGMSEEEAFDYAMKATGQNVLEAGKMGAMAGGLMGGLGMGVNAVTGRNIIPNNEEAIERARAQYEAATRQPETTAAEPVENPTVTPQNTSQNPVTVHETAISEELNNSSHATETLPTGAQTKQAKTRVADVSKKASEAPMTAKFLANEFHGEGRKVVQDKLNETGNTKVIEQAMPFYTGALSGQSFESIRNKYATTATTDYDYAKAVFDAGLADRDADVVARMKGRGKFAKSKGVILDDVAITEAQKALANYVSKVGGMTIRVVETADNDNGVYDRNKNEILIALDSQYGFTATLFHETVHFIKAANAEGYQKLQDTVFRMAAKLEGKPVEVFMREYKQTWEKDSDMTYGAFDVMEEMTADAMMKIASDEKGMKELVNALKGENPTVLEQLKEFIDKLLQALEDLVKDRRFAEFAEAIHKDIENTRELRKMFAEELMVAGEYAKANEDVKKQPAEQTDEVKFSKKMSFADQVDAVLKGSTMFSSSHVYMMETPDVLTNIGLRKLPILMTAKHISTIAKDDGKHKDSNYHGLGSRLVKQIPEAMEHPIAVYESETRDDSIVVLLELRDKNGDPVVVTIRFDGTGLKFGRWVEANIATSAYGRDTVSRDLMTAPFDGRMLYFDKEKSRHLEVVPRVQFPSGLENIDFTDNITRFRQKIKSDPATKSEAKKSVKNVGAEFDTETNSAYPIKRSARTWNESDYAKDKEKAAKALAKAMDIPVDKAMKWIDDINGVAKIIADDRERLDYEANLDDSATTLKSNSEYKWTLDMSTLCAKRLWYTGTFDAIQKAMPNTAFNSEEITRIRTMMMEKGYEVACGICYVESTRREIGPITLSFIEQYKKAQKTGKPITRINSEGKEIELKQKGDKAKRFYAENDYTPTLADLNTTDIDIVKRDHPEVYAAYLSFMNARGQAKPKLLETRAEYKGEIAKTFNNASARNARNKAGGLRVQSFSDFEVPHMIDMMQAVMDMAKVKLKAQAYTKVPEFAAVFGGTGMKINLSLIAKGDGVDSKGRLIFDDVEGIDHKKAFELREQYSENVGTILVGKNDRHIIAAMADPKIDFIIPFHKSSWKESLYEALGLTGYSDYTATQNEKPIDPDREISNFAPSEYWDYSKTGDENAQIYLEKCREDGRIPKFPEFSTYPGYWKLLIDFKMYDNDGVGSPQMEVQPEFNMKEAKRILKAYEGGHRSFPVAQDVVDEFVEEYKSNNEGKKFSRRTTEDLKRENADLKKANENLRGIFNVIGRQRITETSAKEVATAWLKNIGSSYDKDEFAGKFKIIAEHMADARNEYEAEDAVEAMKNLAMEAMRKSEEVDTAAWEENKDLYNKVKSTKLFVSDDVAEDLKAYGGYASVVRDTYGKMDLSRKADKGVTDIDVLYGELNAENELLFPYEDGMTKANMLMNIADGMESLQPVMKNKYGYTEEEMAEDVVYDLFDRMGDLTYRTSSLESDLKSNEKYTQLKAEYEKRIAKVRREAEQQREKYESDAEARYARLKDRHKEQRINREMKKARETVERESKRLLTWLTGGTDKNHVPENMRAAVEKILTSITTKDARINQLQLIALKDVYGEHSPERESGDYLEYDPDVTEILKKFTKQDKYKDGIIVLDDLSLEEMKNLSKMIRSLKHTIQKANKWMGLQRDLNVAEICDNQAFEWDNVKDATTYGAVRQLHKYFGMSMADANVFFKEFGKVAHETVWRGLRTAFDKKINFLAEAEEFSKGIDQKQVAKWRAMPPQKFELPSGDIWLTPTQVMSLYCLAKRDDAKRHLYGGGIKAAAFKFMWKLGAKFPKEAMKQYAGRRVTEADINAITATLTDEQKATADKIQKFMVEHCAKWGNATSMLMFGYMKFGDPNYFPIRVDGDTLTSSVGDPQLRIKSIQNTGAAMPIDERAKNALVLEDIFSVLASHVEEMSSYAAFVPALSDLNKFVNYNVRNENGEIIFSMKTEIGQKVGPDAMGYIYDLLETLNGSPRAVKEGILPKTLVRNAKTASVAANLRVIAQQPTAYLRAGIVLDAKYLLQGMAPGKVDKEEVFKYCPIARWKAMGNYDMNIGKTVEQLVTGQTLYQKIIDKSMAGARWADSVTWGWIWKACKAETADKYPDLQGEEFLIKAGERMSEVIDDTQVVDSPLHRSQMMRNKSLYMQMITAYMSEPTKAVGLVVSSVIECRKNPTKENKKKVMRTWRYLIATGVLTAAFAGAVDMFRDDDEDEELWEKFLQAFWGDQINAETPKDRAVALLGSNIGDNLNPLNSLPLMRDILSMLQGYEITRTDFAWMADIMNNVSKWNKYLSGESEYTLTALLGNTAQSLSKVTGMPVKSASRELDSVRRAVVGHMSGDIQYQNAKITYSISAEKNISRYVAMMLEARMNGDKALATKIYNEMVKAGIDNEKIDNKIDSVSKKALESEIEVADGAEAYREGDYDALIGAIDSLNKKGYSEKNATSAITKAYNEKYGDDEEEELTYDTITESYWNDDLEESPADYQMMENAFMFGSTADYNELWKVLELNGKKETNMKTTMKNRLRKIYHETGTSSSDKARIEKEFTRLGGKLETLYKKP